MPVRNVVLEKSERKIEREIDRNKHYESRILMPFGINLIMDINVNASVAVSR